MSKMHNRTSAYSTSAVLPIGFVNMDPNNLSTMHTCILYAAEQRNTRGCIQHIHVHSSFQRNNNYNYARNSFVHMIRLMDVHVLNASAYIFAIRENAGNIITGVVDGG